MHDGSYPLDHLRHVFDAGHVEEAARDEVSRLLLDGWKDPALPKRTHVVAGRPSWWWRFRLLEWAQSVRAVERCTSDALRAFRGFVTDLSESEICLLVESLLPQSSWLADTA